MPNNNLEPPDISSEIMSVQPNNVVQPIITGYPPGSVLNMAYGGSDPTVIATQYISSGELYRLQRGYPYKRYGHMVPVFPQFKTQNITLQNLASQPQSNASVKTIVSPKADPNTTNANNGSTPFIGFPGFVNVNLT